MSVSWHSFDLRSGRRGPRVTVQKQGTVSRIIGEATDTTLSVDVTTPDYDSATLPGRVMLVALEDDTERIIWGGLVLREVANDTSWGSISVSTLEHYLERRYAGDLTFTGADQATIAAGVMDGIAVAGLNFTVDAPATGTLRDRTYADDEDKTALSILTDLMGVEDGLEFTVELEWADTDHTLLNRVVRFRPRLGTSPAMPTQWTMPGCVTSFEYIRDYTPENGANDVLATSSGEGETRPESSHQVATNLQTAGWARFDRRFTPSTSITDTATLDAHAAAELARVRTGLTQLTLTAALDAAPRLNQDWWLGDDIEVSLTCPRFPEKVDADGGLVAGYTQRLRVVGWEVDLDAEELRPNTREVQ